ncbi:GyrI-like domain-containing protein [Actinomyces sp. ZJ308]|uniref:GyrI-like domain-containing protein n=1 Tax=Actinomyces sp. ZJ308 TaxID=2708342 RepID=UPI00141DC2F1|nr:GyrI-like domain-containing protein [Actinomyces sp. ZJ308]
MRTDIKKDRKDLYLPTAADFTEVEVPAMTYLAIDGHGDPNTAPAYVNAIQALYAGAYAIRSVLKQRTGDDFVVGPLEGLWTSPNSSAFVALDKGSWDWTMMIPLPEAVSSQDVAEGLARAGCKKPGLPIGELRELRFVEGRSLQILHVGTYDDEAPTLARLHDEVMPSLGLTWNGPHHEIYLSDPRRVAPEKMRTVLRQPVRPEAGGSEAG